MPASVRVHIPSIELADGVMLAVVAIWAANNVITKTALDAGLAPSTYVGVRFALVAVILWGYLLLRREPVRIRRSDLPRFIVSGLSGFAIYNMLFVIGLAHTSAFSAAILISLAPVFMLVIAAVLGLERVLPLQWLGVALSLLGVAIFIGDKLLAGKPAFGDLLNVAAALCFAIYGLTTGSLVHRYGPSATTAWSVTVGLIGILPFTARTLLTEDWSAIGRIGWAAMVYAAVISMMLAYSLWGWAIARTGSGRSVPYLFLIPVLTGIFAIIFRGDHLEAAQVVGGAIALGGVAIARLAARSHRRPAPDEPLSERGRNPVTERKPRTIAGP